MTSSFTSRLKLERQASGENSGNWGNLVNYVLNRVDASVKGYQAVNVAGSSNVTLTSNNSTSNTDDDSTDDQVHNAILEFTGALTGNINVFTDAVETNYALFNNTSGSYTLNFANTGHAANGVSVKQGTKTIVYSTGSKVEDIMSDLGDIEATNVTVDDGGSLKIQDTTGGEFVGLKANATTTSYTLTLPPATGSADQVMATDGSGNLSFTDVSGSVDWQTTVQTSNVTAATGKGYFVNTTSGILQVLLPSGPSAGDIIGIKDYAQTFGTNKCIIARNSSNISGTSFDGNLQTNGEAIVLYYIDGTRGWIVIGNGQESTTGTATFISASGGSQTCSGDYRIHTFTGPGTFTVSSVGNPAGSSSVDYLLIAGGGGGGGANAPSGSPYGSGGGGGGGGYRESSGAASGCYSRTPLGACVAAITVSASPGAYPIVVGGGAPTTPFSSVGAAGTPSTGLGLTSTGGGGGGNQTNTAGIAGGSGGGGAGGGSGGAGNTPSVTPAQGTAGGDGTSSNGGGGGGATAAGSDATSPAGGDGGTGGSSAINAVATGRSGGGGGGTYGPGKPSGTGTCGGGPGGPGPGSTSVGPGQAGTVNTGGGGGGGSTIGPNPGPSGGGGGGSGVVIIRYKYK
tara:strand:+ start:2550 stop:4427 length:1878 start_codon:yes stop_codon:yes gene_type:complete